MLLAFWLIRFEMVFQWLGSLTLCDIWESLLKVKRPDLCSHKPSAAQMQACDSAWAWERCCTSQILSALDSTSILSESLQILWNIVVAVKIANVQWPQRQLRWIPRIQQGMSRAAGTGGSFLTRLSTWCDGGCILGYLVSLSSYFFSALISSLPAGSGRYHLSFQ